MTPPHPLLRRFRIVLLLFMVGLIISGVTAFPLLWEMRVLCDWLGAGSAVSADGLTGLTAWVVRVRLGLEDMYAQYPWIAYGTDWLAFAHVVLAVFFIGPLVDPVRNVWVWYAGMIACALVVPLAMICGPLRGIPFGWQMIDCSFGIIGVLPLWYCVRLVKRMTA